MRARLGQKVRDLVTRTEGIITARTEYLNGCVRYCIQPQVTEPSEIASKVEWVDEQQLVVLDDGVRGAMGLDDRRAGASVTGGTPKADAPRG